MNESLFRVGLIGAAHAHVWGTLRRLENCDLGYLASASIESKPELEARKMRVKSGFGLEKIYEDYNKMLEKEDLDIIFNYTDHLQRVQVTKNAAAHGLHVMVEKPMAYNLRDAESMIRAAEKHKIKLMVNWPIAWSLWFRRVCELVKKGVIGDIFHIRTRNGHDLLQKDTLQDFYDFQWMGSIKGCGAFMDFCCYGAMLARWLMGAPKGVFGTVGRFVKLFIPSNDNGILVILFDKGTAVVEGTWSQIGRFPEGPAIFGSEGSIMIREKELPKIYTKEYLEGKAVELSNVPSDERNAVEYFLTRVKENQSINNICNPKIGRDVQEILEAGLISSETKRVVQIPIQKQAGDD